VSCLPGEHRFCGIAHTISVWIAWIWCAFQRPGSHPNEPSRCISALGRPAPWPRPRRPSADSAGCGQAGQPLDRSAELGRCRIQRLLKDPPGPPPPKGPHAVTDPPKTSRNSTPRFSDRPLHCVSSCTGRFLFPVGVDSCRTEVTAWTREIVVATECGSRLRLLGSWRRSRLSGLAEHLQRPAAVAGPLKPIAAATILAGVEANNGWPTLKSAATSRRESPHRCSPAWRFSPPTSDIHSHGTKCSQAGPP